MRAPGVRTLRATDTHAQALEGLPNFHISGSVRGMRKQFWGFEALIVRCGSYYYNVTSKPHIYERAH